jgi:hypothetical protein
MRVLESDETISDAVTNEIRDVVNRVRGAVRSCASNKSLGPEGTVPPELVGATAILCVEALATNVSGTNIMWTKAREDAAKKADKLLEAVAACKYRVSPAEDAPVSSPPQAPGKYGGDAILTWPDTCLEEGP